MGSQDTIWQNSRQLGRTIMTDIHILTPQNTSIGDLVYCVVPSGSSFRHNVIYRINDVDVDECDNQFYVGITGYSNEPDWLASRFLHILDGTSAEYQVECCDCNQYTIYATSDAHAIIQTMGDVYARRGWKLHFNGVEIASWHSK